MNWSPIWMWQCLKKMHSSQAALQPGNRADKHRHKPFPWPGSGWSYRQTASISLWTHIPRWFTKGRSAFQLSCPFTSNSKEEAVCSSHPSLPVVIPALPPHPSLFFHCCPASFHPVFLLWPPFLPFLLFHLSHTQASHSYRPASRSCMQWGWGMHCHFLPLHVPLPTPQWSVAEDR